MHSKGDSLILTEDNKSDDQERASDQQEAGGCLPLSGPTGHSLSRKASVWNEGRGHGEGGVDNEGLLIGSQTDFFFENKPLLGELVSTRQEKENNGAH
jgi:hypothetical protein